MDEIFMVVFSSSLRLPLQMYVLYLVGWQFGMFLHGLVPLVAANSRKPLRVLFFLLTSNLIRKPPLLDQCRGASVYRRCLRGVLPTEMRLRRIRGSRLQQQKSSGLGETRRRRRLERRRRILRKDGSDEASSRVGQEKRKMKVGV